MGNSRLHARDQAREWRRSGRGDAMAIPFAENRFDAAVMALVIFFVREPTKGIAEMVRVVRPGGMVAAYAWDIEGGGFPLESFRTEMREMGIALPLPPSSGASKLETLQKLWSDAGLVEVETRAIVVVERTFCGFDDLWTTTLGSSFGQTFAGMACGDVAARLPGRAALLISGARIISCCPSILKNLI
jgi:SAM-dependent methyltransferase